MIFERINSMDYYFPLYNNLECGVGKVYIGKSRGPDGYILVSIDYKHEPRVLRECDSLKRLSSDIIELNSAILGPHIRLFKLTGENTITRVMINIKLEDVLYLPNDIQVMILMNLEKLI